METNFDQEKLTAYVLGELDENERAEMEVLLQENPEARALANELNAAKLVAEAVFAGEPSLSLSEEQREEVRQHADQTPENVVPFRRSYWRLLLLKVAAVLVVVAGGALLLTPNLSRYAQPSHSMEIAKVTADAPSVDSYLRREAAEAREPFPAAAPAEAPAPAKAPEAAASAAAPPPAQPDVLDQLKAGNQSQQQILTARAGGSMGSSMLNMQVQGSISIGRGDSKGKDASANQPGVRAGGGVGPYGMDKGFTGKEAEAIAHDEPVPMPKPAPPNPYNDPSRNYWPGHNTEAYKPIDENQFLAVGQNPLSTFSIDVDTASYANMRRFLNQNMMPPPDSVRIEELVNYFKYDYAPPTDKETPFAAHVTIADCPWTPEHRLARIGIKGWEIPAHERPASNLVFLVDVSGSMQPENKLPLVKKALRMLVDQLDERDHVALAVYASASGLVLPSTPGNQKSTILRAIEQLQSGGSTQGSAGIQLAYETAVGAFIPGGCNRVILCTDGDFNVGITDEGSLGRLITDKAKSGVFLSVLGFGMGNLKDSTMETLADKGNGNYAYIDTESEARKALVDQMQGTLITIAKDVKIQVEFNPARVSAYRLIGYENRMLKAEDFNNDKKDAGEIGAGHTVTALYEIVPAGQAISPAVDALKYQQVQSTVAESVPVSGEMLTLKIRYKKPDGDVSTKQEFPILDAGMRCVDADADFKFAAAVAEFGMLLRNSQYKGNATCASALELAEAGRGTDQGDYRREFIDLVRRTCGQPVWANSGQGQLPE